MTIDHNKMILVTGITGKQGSAVARHLISDGWRVRGLTRNPDSPAGRSMRMLGAQVYVGDFDEAPSLRRALEGCYGAFSVQTPYGVGADVETRQGITFADEAKSAGIKHLVYSSVGGAERNTGINFFDSKWLIEEHIRSISLPATILRPVFFMDNFDSPEMLSSILSGTLSLPLQPKTKLQMIAVDDIGGIAAMALDNPGDYIGKAFEIAGDELTMPEAANQLTGWLGRPVRFVRSSIEDVRRKMPPLATMYEWFDLHGYNCPIDRLRSMYPPLKDFTGFLRASNFGKVAVPIEVGAGR